MVRTVTTGVLAAVLVGCGSETPQDAYHAMAAMAKAGDWGRIYDERIDPKHQAQLETSIKASMWFADRDLWKREANQLSGRELFEWMIANGPESAGLFDAEIVKVKVDGDEAELELQRADAAVVDIEMARRNRKWLVTALQQSASR